MKKSKCVVCNMIYGKSNIKKSIDCTKCAILDCFETKLSATDKTVVDDFVDNYDMYINSPNDEDADYHLNACINILVTLIRMTNSDSEYWKLVKLTDKLLYA